MQEACRLIIEEALSRNITTKKDLENLKFKHVET